MELNSENGIRIVHKKKGYHIDCLADTEDVVVFLAKGVRTAVIEIEKLQEIAEKTGLQISFEYTDLV